MLPSGQCAVWRRSEPTQSQQPACSALRWCFQMATQKRLFEKDCVLGLTGGANYFWKQKNTLTNVVSWSISLKEQWTETVKITKDLQPVVIKYECHIEGHVGMNSLPYWRNTAYSHKNMNQSVFSVWLCFFLWTEYFTPYVSYWILKIFSQREELVKVPYSLKIVEVKHSFILIVLPILHFMYKPTNSCMLLMWFSKIKIKNKINQQRCHLQWVCFIINSEIITLHISSEKLLWEWINRFPSCSLLLCKHVFLLPEVNNCQQKCLLK